MSASREKKQRQGNVSAAEAKQLAMEQEAAARRKTIQYTIIGVVVAIAVAALLIWNSGFFQRMSAEDSVALTIGTQEYSPAEVNYYYFGNYQMYAYYGLIDPSADLKATEYAEGQTWHDFLLETSKNTLTNITAQAEAAAAAGYTLSEEGKASVQNEIAGFKDAAKEAGYGYSDYLRLYYGDYMTNDALVKCLEREVLVTEYQTKWAEQQEVTTADLNSYYTENKNNLDTIHYTTYTIDGSAPSTKDADGNTVEPTSAEATIALQTARQQANTIADALKAGEDVAAMAEEYEASVNKDASAAGSSLSTIYSEWLTDADRQEGDVTVIESTTTLYVVVFQGREDYRQVNGYKPVNTRHILIRAEMDEGATVPTDEQMAAAKAAAEDLLAQWKAGEATEDTFAALANEHSEDAGSNTNGGLYEGVMKGDFVDNYDAWLFANGRKVGDTGVVENNGVSNYYGYHVVYLSGYGDTSVWETELDTTIRNAALSEHITELAAEYTATEGDGIKYVG